MKLALVCPSSMLYMPYVNNYEKVLKELNVNYTIINWDRFHIEDNTNNIVYTDKKIGHQRNYLDYIKYSKFVIQKLKEGNYDKIIVFTLQMGHFLKRFLMGNFKDNYILDIRDYNKIFKFSNFKELIDKSSFTVISSPGFKKVWLPNSNKYVINHNTIVSDLNSFKPSEFKKDKSDIEIATIGVIRHWDANIKFVNKLKNLNYIKLVFHGEGTINKKLKSYIEQNSIRNVQIQGRYKKEDERDLYHSTDLVNTILYKNDINCRSLLTNRLYNSALYGKPMLSLKGTYLAEQIEKYNLGLVLNSFDNLEKNIFNYIERFDILEYEKGRISFFNEVIKDNNNFACKLKEFSD